MCGIEDGLEPAGLIGALIVAVERDQHRFGVSGNDHQFLCVEGRRLRYVERVPSAVAVAMVQIEDLFAARWVAPSVDVGHVGRLADSIDALPYSEGHYDLFGCIDSFTSMIHSFNSFHSFISFKSFHSMIHSIQINDSCNSFHSFNSFIQFISFNDSFKSFISFIQFISFKDSFNSFNNR